MRKLYDLLSAMCGKIKKPDWNQNDPAAPDYVKNRPFWTDDPVETVLIEEQTVSVGDDLYATLDGVTAFVVGEKYTVFFNGTEYECIAWAANALDYESVIVGNGSIWGGDGGNGEPFALEYTDGANYLNVAETGDYVVSVSAFLGEVHKIDSKYLPDGVLAVSSVATKYAVSPIYMNWWVYDIFDFEADGANGTREIPYSADVWGKINSLRAHAQFVEYAGASAIGSFTSDDGGLTLRCIIALSSEDVYRRTVRIEVNEEKTSIILTASIENV